MFLISGGVVISQVPSQSPIKLGLVIVAIISSHECPPVARGLDLVLVSRGCLPSAGGQWEEPGHYLIRMHWGLFHLETTGAVKSFI